MLSEIISDLIADVVAEQIRHIGAHGAGGHGGAASASGLSERVAGRQSITLLESINKVLTERLAPHGEAKEGGISRLMNNIIGPLTPSKQLGLVAKMPSFGIPIGREAMANWLKGKEMASMMSGMTGHGGSGGFGAWLASTKIGKSIMESGGGEHSEGRIAGMLGKGANMARSAWDIFVPGSPTSQPSTGPGSLSMREMLSTMRGQPMTLESSTAAMFGRTAAGATETAGAAVAEAGAGAATEGAVETGLVALGVGLGEATVGIGLFAAALVAGGLKIGEAMLASQRELAKFNSQIALAYSTLLSGDIRRSIESGRATAGTTTALVDAINNLRDEFQPLEDLGINILNLIGTEAAYIARAAVIIIKLSIPFMSVLEWLMDHLPGMFKNQGNLGQQDLADIARNFRQIPNPRSKSAKVKW